MLSIESLSKTYRGASAPALEAVSFSISRGEFVALLGANGAGKSTLLSAVTGRVEPDAGVIRVGGVALGARGFEPRAVIGVVPQEARFEFVFTAEELLRLELGLYGLRPDEGRIRYLLQRLSLWDKRAAKVRLLSGGMQRRLMIARALVHRPRLLLLDEPTVGVDLDLRREMHEFLRELNGEGVTIVLTTHYLEEAQELCGRVLMLDRGRLVADEPREVFTRLAGDFLTVEVRARATDRLWAALEVRGAEASRPGPGMLRLVVPSASRGELLRRLAAVAAEIDSFQVLEPSLEDAFAKLTHERRSDRAGLAG